MDRDKALAEGDRYRELAEKAMRVDDYPGPNEAAAQVWATLALAMETRAASTPVTTRPESSNLIIPDNFLEQVAEYQRRRNSGDLTPLAVTPDLCKAEAGHDGVVCALKSGHAGCHAASESGGMAWLTWDLAGVSEREA